MKKLRVTVEGKVFEVLVEVLDEGQPTAVPASAPRPVSAPVTPPPAAVPAPSAPVAAAGDIVSPLAGKVVSIDVQVGQQVAAGTQVATIEAMKMNTYVYASGPGKVAAIIAKSGDSVEEGGPLVKIG